MMFRGRAHRWGMVLGLVALSGVHTGAVRAEDAPPAPFAINWYYSLEQGLARSSEVGQQVAAVFFTDWCQWCRRMDDSTFSNDRLRPLVNRLVFVRVNAESDTAAAHRYRVRAYPTVVILTSEGKEVDRIVGYLPPDKFEETMSDYLDGNDTYWDIDRRLKKDTKNPELVYAIAEKYELRGEIDLSRENYRNVVKFDETNREGRSDDALFALARLHRENGEWYKAVEGFRRMIDAYPESELRGDAAAYIPWLYEQARDTAQALKYYRAFVKDYKGSPDRQWAERRIEALAPPGKD